MTASTGRLMDDDSGELEDVTYGINIIRQDYDVVARYAYHVAATAIIMGRELIV